MLLSSVSCVQIMVCGLSALSIFFGLYALPPFQRRPTMLVPTFRFVKEGVQGSTFSIITNKTHANVSLSLNENSNPDEAGVNDTRFYHGIPTGIIYFQNMKLYGPFVSPNRCMREPGSDEYTYSSSSDAEYVYVVFPLLHKSGAGSSKSNIFCSIPNIYDGFSSKAHLDSGAMVCPVPVEAVLATNVSEEFKLKLILISQENNKNYEAGGSYSTTIGTRYTKTVSAATWPFYHARKQQRRLNVIQTSMIRDLDCKTKSRVVDASLHHDGNLCLRDWLEWHLMIGIDHFVLYDNGSASRAPHLAILHSYISSGKVTLIDWPYTLGGLENNLAQRVALNHAIYAFSSRTKWMGFFDVDEFFIPYPKTTAHVTEFSTTLRISTIDAVLEKSHKRALEVSTRSMTHPDYCSDLYNKSYENKKGTSRLALCTDFVRKKSTSDHTKTFRQFPNGPYSIRTPHHIAGSDAELNRTLGIFFHFSSKYGCTPDPKRMAQCKPSELFRQPVHFLALQQLETKLEQKFLTYQHQNL